jgi:tetratricopeptide (TPR) repeat protein
MAYRSVFCPFLLECGQQEKGSSTRGSDLKYLLQAKFGRCFGKVFRPSMYVIRLLPAVGLGIVVCAASPIAHSQNLKITIPLHSELTPVQRLNREGVDAIVKQRYEKAEGLFYKAYLYDPVDPFTLNNLGYVSELQGQVDRAEQFYKLATEQGSFATIDRSNAKQLKGRPMMDALGTLKNLPMRVNRIDVLGMELLTQDHPFEAEALFKESLALDPHNAFTLNDLGVAEEAVGNLEDALKHYDEAAATHSMEPVVVTLKREWRGKPVSEMAANSSQDLRKRMQTMTPNQIRAAMLAVRGVHAINQNDWNAAKQDFLEAYSLDPESAFSLNNRGYVAERDGDLETAVSYYARALKADDADSRIGLATQSSAQGQHLAAVADESHRDVDSALEADIQKHRGQKTPFELKRRNDTTTKPEAPAKPQSAPASPDSSTQQPTQQP